MINQYFNTLEVTIDSSPLVFSYNLERMYGSSKEGYLKINVVFTDAVRNWSSINPYLAPAGRYVCRINHSPHLKLQRSDLFVNFNMSPPWGLTGKETYGYKHITLTGLI